MSKKDNSDFTIKSFKKLHKTIKDFFVVYKEVKYSLLTQEERDNINMGTVEIKDYPKEDPNICINESGTHGGVIYVPISALKSFEEDPMLFKYGKMYYLVKEHWGKPYDDIWKQVKDLKR
jgi:hypothetical protein